MERTMRFGSMSGARFWIATTILVALIFGNSLLTRYRTTEARVLAAACLTALATLAIAGLTVGAVHYPRRAYWITAALMAAGVLGTVFTAGTPQVWSEETRSVIWIAPWFFMLMAFMKPPARGQCAPDSPTASRFLIGTGVVYSLILQVPSLLHRS